MHSMAKVRLFLHLLSFPFGKSLIFSDIAHRYFTIPNITPFQTARLSTKPSGLLILQ